MDDRMEEEVLLLLLLDDVATHARFCCDSDNSVVATIPVSVGPVVIVDTNVSILASHAVREY